MRYSEQAAPAAENASLQRVNRQNTLASVIIQSVRWTSPSLFVLPLIARSVFTLALLALLTIGCASPTPPRPPSLNLPEPVTDLVASRSGDIVLLRWTNPQDTTDGTDLKGPITAEVCRQDPSPAPGCTIIQTLLQKPGPASATDNLPSRLGSGTASLLKYHVRLLNSAKRAAAPSNPAYAGAGAAPPAIRDLRATPTRTGIQLQWQPANSPGPATTIELARHHEGDPAPIAKPVKQPLSFSPKPSTAPDVRLQTPTDAGGTLDRTARKGETYHYTAQRVLTVILDGHTLELRSTPSNPATQNLRDTFPPSAPAGLATIPTSLKATPTTPATIAIDLSWEPSQDTDIAGYLVYRQPLSPEGLAQGPFTRITSSPITPPAYRDQPITPGQRYNYRVTAIDATGNESQPTPPTPETAPIP